MTEQSYYVATRGINLKESIVYIYAIFEVQFKKEDVESRFKNLYDGAKYENCFFIIFNSSAKCLRLSMF